MTDAERRQPYRGRYAPSPTGPLHLGNLRTALLAWLHARLHNGELILRIDDLDAPRNVAGADQQHIDDLRWLGLDWDYGPAAAPDFAPYYQLQRLTHYKDAIAQLGHAGYLYPCDCSRRTIQRDLQRIASAPHQTTDTEASAGLIYPGTCRQRQFAELAHNLAPNLTHSLEHNNELGLRFRVSNTVEFIDGLCGPVSQQLEQQVGDFIVQRRDGIIAYHLANVVDDAQMGVTDVLRGDDLLSSTPRQIALGMALGYATPQYWHVPLLRDGAGQRLAKRDHASGLQPLQQQGQQPAAVIALLARSCGLLDQHCQAISAAELQQELTLEQLQQCLARQ